MGGKSNSISNLVKDVAKSVDKATGSKQGSNIFNAINSTGIGEIDRKLSGDKIILSPTNQKEEAAKDAAKADTRQREQAISDQKELDSNLRRQEATSADASGGSTILLGKKGKKSKKGSSVSAGMGLSIGKTGLQS